MMSEEAKKKVRLPSYRAPLLVEKRAGKWCSRKVTSTSTFTHVIIVTITCVHA
jgi:hypothetical protein